jgi:hypothetical protein
MSMRTTKKVTSKKTTTNVWTKSDKNTLARMLKAGHSAVETAKELGRTVSAVWNKKYQMKEAGLVSGTFRSNTEPMKVKAVRKLGTIKMVGLAAAKKPATKKPATKAPAKAAPSTKKPAPKKKSATGPKTTKATIAVSKVRRGK